MIVGREVRLLAHVRVHVHALQALHEDAHGAVRQLDHLVREPDGADRVEQVRPGGPRSRRPRLVTRASSRSPASTSSMSLMQRSWPMVSGIIVSGKTTVSAQRQHRQPAGDLLRAGVHLDLLRIAHSSPPPDWISILRARFALGEREPDLEDARLVRRCGDLGVHVDHEAHAALERTVVHLDLLVHAALALGERALAAHHELAPVHEQLDVARSRHRRARSAPRSRACPPRSMRPRPGESRGRGTAAARRSQHESSKARKTSLCILSKSTG